MNGTSIKDDYGVNIGILSLYRNNEQKLSIIINNLYNKNPLTLGL